VEPSWKTAVGAKPSVELEQVLDGSAPCAHAPQHATSLSGNADWATPSAQGMWVKVFIWRQVPPGHHRRAPSIGAAAGGAEPENGVKFRPVTAATTATRDGRERSVPALRRRAGDEERLVDRQVVATA